MTPKCPRCGKENSKKLPLSSRDTLIVWLVLIPILIVVVGALAAQAPDLAPAIGCITFVAGLLAICKFFIFPAESNWKCPDCHQHFNFDSRK